MRPDLGPTLHDEDEEPSGMKTPLDLQDFEHLLPLFSTPPSDLAFAGELLLSPQLPTVFDSFPTPSRLPDFAPGPFDRSLTSGTVSEPGATEEDISSDTALLRRLLISPKASQPQPERCEANLIREQALLDYIGLAKDNARWDSCEPSCSSPLFEVTRPPVSRKDGFGPLRASSRWSGHQRSGARSYSVSVRILHLDLQTGSGSGLLEITGLTEKWPKLVTFFDIEIVGAHHSFMTKSWGATPQSDHAHWSRFPHYRRARSLERVRRVGDQAAYQPFLFMRWKERFLDGNPQRREIEGASFAGFYYVCLDLTGVGAEGSEPGSPAHARDDCANFVRNIGDGRRRSSDVSLSGASDRSASPGSRHWLSGIGQEKGVAIQEMQPSWHMSTEPLPSIPISYTGQSWSDARITAYYYHAKSEPYQELNLQPDHHLPHTPVAGPSATYQFS
ncbi:hypothetical protein CROQUDRAFT_315097 [Cronartium quercuum f. sp. fusiforme G11]|uniref:Uncharacterized protein n=1 Tax=Cronartium quercuum f. sp. fusiforme G11 TaxID=708437 RepID=A0A9P6TIW5_9BASI|nr:hypothetical protein CROQUDRAFT_315097 [Cronartium quercuum f. sp. fusiforme G11]